MSKNRNSNQLVQLSNSLATAFLEANRLLGKGQLQRRQSGAKVKSLRSFLQLFLQISQSRLQGMSRWFQALLVKCSVQTSSRQPFSDAWTTDMLIRFGKAKAGAFFVDFE